MTSSNLQFSTHILLQYCTISYFIPSFTLQSNSPVLCYFPLFLVLKLVIWSGDVVQEVLYRFGLSYSGNRDPAVGLRSAVDKPLVCLKFSTFTFQARVSLIASANRWVSTSAQMAVMSLLVVLGMTSLRFI